MNLYRIDNLVFKNFKLFDEKLFTIKFDNNDLVVFDGPNGYGKTTVYDALELALTGNIRRLIPVENRQVPDDVVVAHKKRPNCEVKLTLVNVNNNSTVTIIRRLKLQLPPQSKKIANFSMLWDLFQLENGSENRIEQGVLDSLIGTENLSRDYTLFHYVEQEDTAHFLKSKTEVERAKALAKIFGDPTEVQCHHKKIEDVGKRIAKEIKKVDGQIGIIDEQYNFSENNKLSDSNENVDFKVLLQWRDRLAIIPFYLTFAIDLRSIRLFRMFRLFRIFKLARYNKALIRFARALKDSKEELVIFSVACLVMLYISAVGIYYFENSAQPDVFKSIIDCLWWAVATLTTVGYGDVYPITIGGKLFTFFILLIGLGMVAVPAGILSSSLTKIDNDENI